MYQFSSSNGVPSAAETSDLQSNPFYIHPSEGPTSVTITPPLTESNYYIWARSMKRALILKNKYRFIDGTIGILSPDDVNFDAWDRCNNLVQSWLISSVSPQIAQTVVSLDNAIDVWNELRERFSKANRIRIADLQNSISTLRQGNSSVIEYYISLKSCWEELEHYRPRCQCDCRINCKAKEFQFEDYVIRFLNGLNDQFSNVRSQILLMEPLPNLNKTLSMALQQERQIAQEHVEDPSAMINSVGGRGRSFLGITVTGARRMRDINLFFLSTSTIIVQILLSLFLSSADNEYERVDFLRDSSSMVFSISYGSSILLTKLIKLQRGVFIKLVLLVLLASCIIFFSSGLVSICQIMEHLIPAIKKSLHSLFKKKNSLHSH